MKGNQTKEGADLEGVVRLLEDLKRLMILDLITAGVQVTQIAKALGVDKSTVSRLVPSRGVQRRT
jgi:IS30 family transposase